MEGTTVQPGQTWADNDKLWADQGCLIVTASIVTVVMIMVMIMGACLWWTAVRHGWLALVLAIVVAVTAIFAITGIEAVANILTIQSI
jgi:hypothetical protein